MQATKQFESDNKWFKLTYPVSWKLEVEDGIYTFTKAQESNWAFQVSAYRMNSKSAVNYDINTDLLHEMHSNPSAKIISLNNRKVIYYVNKSDGLIINYWVVGGKRCKVLCTFTTSNSIEPTDFDKAVLVVESINLQ